MTDPNTGLPLEDGVVVGLDPVDNLLALDDPLTQVATVAFGRIVDETATVEDLIAYRAWIVSLRLDGWTEEEVATSMAVADHLAKKLGVA